MQKTWIKLEELENTYNTLRSARLPLINFGSEKFVKRMDSQIFSKSKVQDLESSDLPSATVLMKMMGHDFDSSRAISTWNLFIFIVISFLFPQNPGCKARFSGYFNKLALIFMNLHLESLGSFDFFAIKKQSIKNIENCRSWKMTVSLVFSFFCY